MNAMDAVIDKLLHISNRARTESSAEGYFTVLYLRMSQSVKEGLKNGVFQDSDRMESLVVRFAQRYFDAIESWHAQKPCSLCWEKAFFAAQHDRISVIQHLLLGINAHINLDLGIAAAETMVGKNIGDLKADFYTINKVISNLMVDIQKKLGELSWPMHFLDDITGSTDTQIANFSISVARDISWQAANALSMGNNSVKLVAEMDGKAAILADKIVKPGFLPNLILKPVKWFEKGDVRSRILLLQQEG